jgi:hypothetical protein
VIGGAPTRGARRFGFHRLATGALAWASCAIAWRVSDEARYVTGVPLPVDAGYVIK